MKYYARQLTVVLISVMMFSTPFSTFAATFDPNFIISDEELQDANTMTREDIQAFLDDQEGYIARYMTTDVSSTLRLSADIIYQSAQRYRINPKYLLVKLQKEQSLINDPNPTQKQLDWATGYGICDSCSMDDPTLQKHKGFGIQVDSAAGIMRWYYDHLNEFDWIKRAGITYAIDNTIVMPFSHATGFLYTYTPHIHGNQNFWNLWQKWFEQVYPDGTLIKTATEPTIYLIQNGEKRAFQNMTALVTRFDPKMIITAPAAEIARYAPGRDITLPNYAVLYDGQTTYLLDRETLRPFQSQEVVRQFGYNPDEIISIQPEELAGYTIGEVITAETKEPHGRVVRVKENQQLYYIKDNSVHPITNEAVYKANFSSLPIDLIQVSDLNGYTHGDPVRFKDGVIFGVTGFNKIYVVENGQRRHVANEEVFNSLGYNWSNIIWVDEFTGLNHPPAQPLYLNRDITPPSTIALTSNVQPNSGVSQENDAPGAEKAAMYRTPANETTTVGPVFTTDVDAYLVADMKSGEILAGKNIDRVRPMASLTKVMTGYRLFKEGIGLNRTVTYNPTEHKSLYHNFRIAEGEKVRNSDLLDAMLVSSLNTPARMLVDGIEPNESAFIARMNGEAKELGLEKTHFTDPSGADLDNVTTAREYLTIFKKIAILNEIQTYLGKTAYEYDEALDIDGKPHHYDSNTNELVEKSNLPFSILASKTGYLDESGANLAMRVKRNSDGKEFIVITLGNADYGNRFLEPERLTTWALSSF